MTTVVVGSYEELILGYKLERNDEGVWQLRLEFSDHSHSSSVRCLGASKSGTYVASGATDERLKLFNVASRLDLGTLADHVGSVNDVQFFADSHLLSASDDGNFCVYSCPDWNLVSKIRAHKGGILSLAIHPSGKLALTLGKDRKLKTWNLVTGRCAFTVGAKLGSHTVKFSPSGNDYATVTNGSLTLFTVANCQQRYNYEPPTGLSISSTLFLQSHPALLIGLSDGNLVIVDTNSLDATAKSVQLHNCRLKCLSETMAMGTEIFVSAGSDGCVRIWDLKAILTGSQSPVHLTEVICGVRITCMVASSPTEVKLKRRKQPDSEEVKKETEEPQPKRLKEEKKVSTPLSADKKKKRVGKTITVGGKKSPKKTKTLKKRKSKSIVVG